MRKFRPIELEIRTDTSGYDGSNPLTILTTQLITRNFNIHTNLDFEDLDYYEKFFEGFYEYFDREIFAIKQPRRLEVFLFDNLKTYGPYARYLTGPGYTEYGFYLPYRNIMVVNADTGLGTVTHELVHHFTHCGFEAPPEQWVSEGVATFFEKFIGHLDEEGKLHITFGYFSNLRLPVTKENFDKLRLQTLIGHGNYPQPLIRSFVMFLHKKGKFAEFMRISADSRADIFGLGALEKVYGKPLDEIEAEWKQWVHRLPMDNDIFLVEESFVKTADEWKEWWSQNEHRLYFSEEEQVYHVKEAYKESFKPAKKEDGALMKN
ncbi:MAG: hypothetical protein ACYTFK_01990 [Planctomycetota bacterium]